MSPGLRSAARACPAGALRAAFSLLLLLAGLCGGSWELRAEEGILSVRASPDAISLEVFNPTGTVQVTEIAAFADAAPRVVARGVRTQGRVADAPRPFPVPLARFDEGRDRLFSSFQVYRENPDGTVTPLGTNRFVEQFGFPAKWERPFPSALSKKGLQVQMVEDALALGIKHAALNVDLNAFVDPRGGSNSPSWEVDGRIVRFKREAIAGLDAQVSPLTASNVVVSLILLTYASGDPARDQIMLHPRYDPRAPNHLSAFNTSTETGALHFRACVEFLADRYGSNEFSGRVANFILGNEVNSHWFWANLGRASMDRFADDYLRTARIAATSLRKISSSARLYLSLEHHWNIRYPGGDAEQAFAGRAFLDYFNRQARERGNFAWHLAFHPYPENLFECRTWQDRSATPGDDSPRITFRNLEVLPRYLGRKELLDPEGKPRRVILSEQGFHTADRPEGELWQAAAYAYAYWKSAHVDGIDAFILHRHIDHRDEGGLRLGLWTRNEQGHSPAEPARRKRIYEVFKAADTPEWASAFAFALPVIGIGDWSELLPPVSERPSR
jgi:hypothetical protein